MAPIRGDRSDTLPDGRKKVFFVKAITGEKIKRGKKYYRCEWLGNMVSWEPEETIMRDCPDMVQHFIDGTKPKNKKKRKAETWYAETDGAYVESILKSRMTPDGQPEYFVKWLYWGRKFNQWVSEELIQECAPTLLRNYLKS